MTVKKSYNPEIKENRFGHITVSIFQDHMGDFWRAKGPDTVGLVFNDSLLRAQSLL